MDCPDFEKFFKKIFFDFKLIFLKSGFFGQALISRLVTVGCSFAAAITGGWNVWWQTRGKHDRFLVGLNGVETKIEQATVLHVVNLSDHSVIMKDWGFIESDGKLFSLPFAWETSGITPNDKTVLRGNTTLGERNATFEAGYVRKLRPMGAYAISITQRQPRIYFDNTAPYWLRIWVRLRLLFQPNYFSW